MRKDTNESKRQLLSQSTERVLSEVLKPGFFGKVMLSFNVQDGVMQEISKEVIEKIRQ